jgi:hypothetical protein
MPLWHTEIGPTSLATQSEVNVMRRMRGSSCVGAGTAPAWSGVAEWFSPKSFTGQVCSIQRGHPRGLNMGGRGLYQFRVPGRGSRIIHIAISRDIEAGTALPGVP